MITILTSVYEILAKENPTVVDLPVNIDLIINLILNIYDRLVFASFIVSKRILLYALFFSNFTIPQFLVNAAVKYEYCRSKLALCFSVAGILKKNIDVSILAVAVK